MFRLGWVTFAVPKAERTLKYPDLRDTVPVTLDGFNDGLEFAPFFDRLEFVGTVAIAEGWMIVDGVVRDTIRHEKQVPLLIRKRFEPGVVEPRLHMHDDLEYALSLDPILVGRLALLRADQLAPEALFELKHLETLTLRYFCNERLPDLFDRFSELRELHLMNMPLVELPPSLGALRHLRTLYVVDTN